MAHRAKSVTSKPLPNSPSTTLEIPSPDDINVPPDNLTDYAVCIFGTKGIGKTTLGSYWGGKNSMVIMSEPRRRNLAMRKPIELKTYTAQQIMDGAPDTWVMLKEGTGRIVEDPTIDNLSFDTIDLIYEMCMHHVSAKFGVTNPSKAGRESSAAWIDLRDEFKSYFDTLRETDLGILFVSHVKEREIESVDGTMMGQQAPSASPACIQYIKSACDFAFMYGYYNNQRCLTIRDPSNNIWTGCGIQSRFCQPDGKPVNRLLLPNDPEEVYSTIESAWQNQEWDADTPEDEREVSTEKPTKIKRRRRSA